MRGGVFLLFCMLALAIMQGGISFNILSPVPSRHSSLFSAVATRQTSARQTIITPVDSSQALPWAKSVCPVRSTLPYMPFLQSQLKAISHLHADDIALDEALRLQTSSVKPARVGSMSFKNEIFRNIRMTYFDAGESVQVFNTLWYPSYEYDIPMLGVDLISIGTNRVVTVIDFQPLETSEEYSVKYIDKLSVIKEKYPDLQGTLSGKIFDDVSFFSKNMLFGRFTDESKLSSVVLPAFEEYLAEYIELTRRANPDFRPESMERVRQRQTLYDQYSASKANRCSVGLFSAHFGKPWTTNFVQNYLFPLCDPVLLAREAAAAASLSPGTSATTAAPLTGAR